MYVCIFISSADVILANGTLPVRPYLDWLFYLDIYVYIYMYIYVCVCVYRVHLNLTFHRHGLRPSSATSFSLYVYSYIDI